MNPIPSFPKAVQRHAFLAQAAQQNMLAGEQIWAGVTGKGGITGLLVDAVADTTPPEYATLTAVDDIAAAFATLCTLEALAASSAPRSAHEARKVAHEGWRRFKELADQGGWIEHGLGADMSSAWPVLRAVLNKSVDENKIRKISDLAGRMHAVLKGRATKRVDHVPEEIVGIEQGSDFPSLIPAEYALAASSATRPEFYKRFLSHETIQYKRGGKEKKARGPLVIALDESGSMIGEPEVWSKAAMTALVRLAWEDKRTCVVVHFSTATRAQRLKPGDYTTLLKAQQTFLDGGTAIGTALNVALENVEELARIGIKGADVVCVSDGGDAEGGIATALDKLEAKGVRLWSVSIGCPFRGQLKERAAAYVHLASSDFGDPKSIGKMAGSVGL